MKGIMFIDPLFDAVIKGNKTMTRRILSYIDNDLVEGFMFAYSNKFCKDSVPEGLVRPRYKVGETVYLKEPYHKHPCFETEYKYGFKGCGAFNIEKWSNKLFMPEKYARYFIEITGVRFKRLRDISDEDCMKEGIHDHCDNEYKRINGGHFLYLNGADSKMYDTQKQAFAALIDRINGKGTWDSNPYVSVYDFKLLNNK